MARYDLSKQVDKIAVPMVSNSGYSRSVRIDGKDGTSYKLMVDANGKVDGQLSAGQFSGKVLSDVVGKEMADKIMKLEKPHEFSGEGLKVGGEGMKGFYDQIIPKSLEKMFKEHGVKVKTVYKHDGNPTQAHRDLIDQMTNDLHDEFYNDALKEGFDKDKAKRFADKHTANIEPWQLAKALNKNAELDKAFKEKLDFEKHCKQPIHYIDIPQSLKDHALKRGFPLFSAGVPVDLLDNKK